MGNWLKAKNWHTPTVAHKPRNQASSVSPKRTMFRLASRAIAISLCHFSLSVAPGTRRYCRGGLKQPSHVEAACLSWHGIGSAYVSFSPPLTSGEEDHDISGVGDATPNGTVLATKYSDMARNNMSCRTSRVCSIRDGLCESEAPRNLAVNPASKWRPGTVQAELRESHGSPPGISRQIFKYMAGCLHFKYANHALSSSRAHIFVQYAYKRWF